jgi:hypothetical protein
VGRDDDPGRARALGAAGDCAEVPRVGHSVEADEKRTGAPGQLVRVRVLVRRDLGDDALVVARARGLAQLPLELHVDARAAVLAEPRLGSERTLGRPELEHLARAAQRLSHGAPAVDLVGGHCFGTSR